MQVLRKAGRILLYTLLGLLVLLVILWFALQTTPVQNWLTQRVAGYLENTLETEVAIEAINWKLPKSVRVEGFYLEDQRGDTLAYLGELSAAVDLKKIAFDGIVEIEEVTARSVYLNAYNTPDRNNLQFLLDAFAPDTTAAPTPVDTTATAMEIRVDNARVLLEDIDIYYEDAPSGLLADVTLERFEGKTQAIDLDGGVFNLGKLALVGADVTFTAPPTDPDAAPTVLDYTIAADELRIERSRANMDLGTLKVATALDEAVFSGTAARLLGDSIALQNKQLTVNNLSLDTDTPGATPQRGFDYNFLRLRNVNADVSELDFAGTEVRVIVNELSGRQESDAALLPRGAEAFVIDQIAGKVAYTSEGLVVDGLKILTERTRLPGADLDIAYNFAGSAPLETMRIDADIPRADISIADILYFAPYLDSIEFLAANKREILTLSAAANGTLERLNIRRFNFNGLETVLRASGTVRNATDPDLLALDIRLSELSTTRDGITSLLPAGTLPDYVELPEKINARGTITGGTNRLNTNLVATASRTGAAVSARLNGRVTLSNLTNPDALKYDVSLDTFFATRREILAYLPPGTLPTDVELPDELRLSGTARGDLKRVTTDLDFQSVRGSDVSTASFAGTINNLDDPDNLELDVELQGLDLKASEILAFLPPGTLPEYIRIPTIEDTKGRVKGSLTNLTADLTVFTTAGDLAIEGMLRNETYDVEVQGRELTIQEFFTPGAYDTIVGLDLEPLELTLLAEGSGFDPYGDMNAKLTLQIQEESRDTRGVLLNGVYAEQEFDGTLVVEETEVELNAEVFADLGAALPLVLADMHIDKLDLQALGITQTRFLAEADVDARLVGFDPADTLYADLRVDSIRILDDSTLYLVDSIVSQARFVRGYNRAYLRSDVLRAEMEGRFDFATIGDRITKQLYGYFEPQVADTMTINSPPPNPDVLDFYLEVFNTEILTAGLVPGLEELQPFFFNGGYNSEDQVLKVYGEIPHIVYSGLVIDTGQVVLRGNAENFKYQVDFAHVAYGDQIDVGRTEIEGGLTGERVKNAIATYDEKGDARLALTAFAGYEDGKIIVQLDENQVLNYNTWQVVPTNRLVVSDRAVTVEDWIMSYKGQSIQLTNPAPEDLAVRFENFKLNTFSELINAQDSLFGGTLTGRAELRDLLTDPLYLANLTINNVELYAGNLGNIDLEMRMDVPGVVAVDAEIMGEGNDLSLRGEYRQNDTANPLDFVLNINAIELPTLVKPAAEFLRAAEGQVVGRVDIKGTLEQPQYAGRLQFQEAMINPALINEPLRIGPEPIVFKGDVITIDKLQLRDSQGGTATLDAKIIAESLTDYDLDVEFVTDGGFQVLNTKPGDNELYYGNLVVNARADITGSVYEPTINVYATPVSGELVYLFPYYQVQNIERADGIVEFINPNAKVIDLTTGAAKETAEYTDVIPMNLEVNVEMNDKVKFKAIMDPVTKDYFEGRGEGNVTYTMDPKGAMGLTGRVTLKGGEYLFTVPSTDFVKRLFQIEEGSYVQFFGNPFNPALNVWVRYPIETSPEPLVATRIQDLESANLPDEQLFYARLNLNGTLEETNIDTDLDYPSGERNNTGNDQIEAAVAALESDESQMNTQVLGLITFNSFLSQSVSAVGILGSGNTGGGGLVYDLVADQLNNIANQYINFVDVEFGVETYGGGGALGLNSARTDYRVTVKQQLFNDRLEIRVDGVTSSSSTPQPGTAAAQTYVDNLTVEYRVQKDGSLRLKVFNKRDIDDFLGGEVIKLGGAAVFSKDFNRIRLFDKQRNRSLESEKEVLEGTGTR